MRHAVLLLVAVCFIGSTAFGADDPLPSWNDGPAKQAIVSFVDKVTTEGSPDFVPPAERIAVFDNDGTLWAEQPAYFQLLFALDRIKAQAKDHPEWQTTEPFKSVLADNIAGVMASGKEGLLKIVAASHADVTAEEFQGAVGDWLSTANNPKTGRLYKDMVYQPMLELLAYLRANNFKTFIVSGGGIDFLRVFAEEAYGIPPEQVVGSSSGAKYELSGGTPTITKLSDDLFIDDKAGKPVGIYRHIGRRPIFAVGNSDGDYEMLQYTTIENPRPSLGLIVHHTDADREFAYDRESHIGQLNKALDEAPQRGWIVVDMKNDWSQIFPSQ
jgi:phosphoglycolate phosphatase-like HAD superfamily hydrolase